jgi:hypothetical protein
MKKVGSGAAWTYKKAASGVSGAGHLVTTGAKKIWPFGGSDKQKLAEAEDASKKAAKAGEQKKAVVAPAPSFTYESSKLWVTDTLLGPEKKTEDNSTITLKEGWEITGSRLHSVTDYVGSPPKLLRAEGTPARASITQDGRKISVQAREIHYNQETGLMALKGFPSAQIGINKVTTQSNQTFLIMNLKEGTFSAEGPIKISSD